MTRRLLALAVLFVFVAGSGLATTDELLHSGARGQAAPVEAGSCPDPGTDGQPCGPACLCLCCPGHANGLAVFAPRPSLGNPPAIEFESEAHDELRPMGVFHSIFHPPRA